MDNQLARAFLEKLFRHYKTVPRLSLARDPEGSFRASVSSDLEVLIVPSRSHKYMVHFQDGNGHTFFRHIPNKNEVKHLSEIYEWLAQEAIGSFDSYFDEKLKN